MNHRTCFRSIRELLVVILVLGLFPAITASQGAQRSSEEGKLFDLLNEARRAKKLPVLRWNAKLAKSARQHTELMVAHNDLSHGFSGEPILRERVAAAGVRFSSVAENVALGATPEVIHNLLMKSPGHLANILDAASNEVGIAVIRRDKDLFAAQNFAHVVPDLDPLQQTALVGTLLQQEGYSVVSREQIGTYCDGDNGPALPGETQIFRFETADLSILPDQLRNKDLKQRFRTASVASCRQTPSKGITAYRMVVVLN